MDEEKDKFFYWDTKDNVAKVGYKNTKVIYKMYIDENGKGVQYYSDLVSSLRTPLGGWGYQIENPHVKKMTIDDCL